MTRAQRYSLAAVSLLCFFAIRNAEGQNIRITLEPFIAAGLNLPVYFTHAHDGTDRRFIVEQTGIISVVQPGSSTRSIFLNIQTRVLSGGERGLLGLAFHPQFADNGRFFVNYTRRPDGATIIAEYHVSAGNPNVADDVESVLMLIPQPYDNHNGGMIEFGPDGYLYIGMGDGGSAFDPQSRAQNVNELLGKILRIDVDNPSPPVANPYAGDVPGRDEIYAIGMRNPWRFSFDRVTGSLYVGDVGQNDREEVDVVTAGNNYGWRVLEGTRCTNLDADACGAGGFVAPVAEYSHATNGRCSITGGYVYRGYQQSLPLGSYVYADYCSGEIFMLQAGIQSVLLDTSFNISSFGEDESGEIYVVSHGGAIYRVRSPDVAAASSRLFSLGERGTAAFISEDSPAALAGYARVQADAGRALPAGMAVIGRRENGVLISEATVAAAPLISSGRVFVDSAPAETGIAIVNPNSQAVTIDFYFTNASGENVEAGSTTIGAGEQLAGFLNQPPFRQPSASRAAAMTFTFASSEVVSVLALRGVTNSRNDFLMAALPVTDLSAPPSGVQTMAHFAWGSGWNTQFVLVNPSDAAAAGAIEAFDPAGRPLALPAGVTQYALPARSAIAFMAASCCSALPLQTGSLRVVPAADSPAPSAFATFVQNLDPLTTIAQASVAAAAPSSSFRMFVENLGDTFSSGSIHTGIAIANPGAAVATVLLELFAADGTPTGLSGTITVPANGQSAGFLHQLPGFDIMPARFRGVLRASSSSPLVLTALRGRYNERNEFLITTITAAAENETPRSAELLFPQIVAGGGYETQFVLFAAQGVDSSGTIYFFDRRGGMMSLPIR
jgi:glucose/arabinose dehydrogenase